MKEENKRRALGRGLEELFSIEDVNYGNLEEKIMETVKEEEVQELPIDELRVNPYQPRKTFNEESLQELSESIKEHGVFQPIIVKKSIKGYEIVAGERRFRASKLAGKKTIPAIVRNFTDEEMMEIAVLENLQRENLNVVDEANAYKTLMTNLNLTQEQVSKRVNKSRSHITNLLGILSLPETVLALIKENKLWLGYTFPKLFKVPDNVEGKSVKVVDGVKYQQFGNIGWYTNLDIAKRHEELILYKSYIPEEYPKYDNFDAIDVSAVNEIPCDYYGIMGVPDSFLEQFNPEQFELIGVGSGSMAASIGVKKNYRGRTDLALCVDGVNKCPFSRILIRRRKQNETKMPIAAEGNPEYGK